MNTYAPKRIIENVMQGMQQADYRPLFETLADDAIWSVIGDTLFSGKLVGKKEILEKRMKPFGKLMAAPPKITARNYICDGNTVVVEAEGQGMAKNGQPYNASYCMIFRLQHGKIAEFIEYFDTDVSIQAFGRKSDL